MFYISLDYVLLQIGIFQYGCNVKIVYRMIVLIILIYGQWVFWHWNHPRWYANGSRGLLCSSFSVGVIFEMFFFGIIFSFFVKSGWWDSKMKLQNDLKNEVLKFFPILRLLLIGIYCLMIYGFLLWRD